MSVSSSTVISTGPARGLVGGITRHMQLLEQIAGRLGVRLEHFQIGRRQGEAGGGSQLRRLLDDYRAFAQTLRAARADNRRVVAHVNSSIKPVCVARDAGFVLIARALRVPVIFQVHGCLLQGRFDGRRWLRVAAQGVLGVADRVVVLSRAQSHAIGGAAAQRAVPVNNAVSMERAVVREADPSRPLRILFLSRLVPEKGVTMCLEAMRLLRDWGLDVRLELAGDGPLLAGLPQTIRQMGLEDCVTLPGFVAPEDTRVKLLDNDLMWLPSLVPEGQPYALLEALEAGMPAVVTRAGAVLGEMIDTAAAHGGPLVEARPDALHLAEATAALVHDPARLAALQRAARDVAEAAYSMDAVLPQWRKVWGLS
ncbi:MAG: glycosyltransferase family 4 protein [Lautropia sp.]|nr:glycosyltransferase family 4 protein [Lautropia sp.]